MNIDQTKIILGSQKNQVSVDVDTTVDISLQQQHKELFEFDRSADVDLALVYDNERQKSTIFRQSAKFTHLFDIQDQQNIHHLKIIFITQMQSKTK